MNQVSRRALCALIVAVALLAGVVVFGVQYFLRGDDWIVFPGSPHVYTGGNLDTGVITDRDGVTLLRQVDGGRTYASDAQLRLATMHLLGDRYGYIASTVLSEYAGELVGYDPITGVYGIDEEQNTLRLTVSADVQLAALEALAGRHGTVGVYNYKTGELLCAVTTPTYDPDNMPDVEGDTTGQYDGVYLNRLTQGVYTPGSIFKIITAAAALETIPDIGEETFLCTGSVTIGGDTITCAGVHGEVDLERALAVSCNCAFAEISQELGGETLREYAQKAGVTSTIRFDGITTQPGRFDVEDAAASEIAWAGIGQYTDQVNPLSFLVLMGTIADGGQAAQPYLAARVTDGDGNVTYRASVSMTESVFEKETCERLQEMMRNNVVSNYGAAQFGELEVCAKSGTAEVGEGQSPHATFAGFVLDEDYPLAFVVVVENAGSGSGVCAPIAAAVLRACVDAME